MPLTDAQRARAEEAYKVWRGSDSVSIGGVTPREVWLACWESALADRAQAGERRCAESGCRGEVKKHTLHHPNLPVGFPLHRCSTCGSLYDFQGL